MINENEVLFSKMKVSRAIMTLALPTIISQIITVIYNMADTFFVGQLNQPSQVAAAALAMPAFVFLTALANVFGIGGASFISRLLGKGDREKARRVASFSIYSGLVIALVYGILIIIFKNQIFPFLGVTSETWAYTYDYVFWTIGIGSVPTVLNPLLSHLVRSEGYSKQAGFGIALGGIMNMILDAIFIFVFGMEIKGAAIATVLSNLIAVVYFVVLIYKKRKTTVISFDPGYFTLGERIPSEVVTVGLPGFMISFMAAFSNIYLNTSIAEYSTNAVAGMGIAKKVNMLAFAVGQGITQGTLPLIAYNYSSGDRARMREIIKKTFAYSILISLAITSMTLVVAGPITRLFIADPETVFYGGKFLRVLTLACTTSTIMFMVITVFQAIGKKLQPIIISMLRKGSIDVLLMYLLKTNFGIDGIVWATPIADIIAVVISLGLLWNFLRRIKRT